MSSVMSAHMSVSNLWTFLLGCALISRVTFPRMSMGSPFAVSILGRFSVL